MRPRVVKAAVLSLLLAVPAFADESQTSFWVAPGIAWTIPFTPAHPDYNGLRQDVAISLLAQLESTRWLGQAEMSLGGLSASNPAFKLFAARLGGFVVRGAAADVSISAGGGYMTYQADTTAECPQFGCDRFDGSGVAMMAEVAARFTHLPVRGGVSLEVILPLFDVATVPGTYPGLLPKTQAIGSLVLGLRIFF